MEVIIATLCTFVYYFEFLCVITVVLIIAKHELIIFQLEAQLMLGFLLCQRQEDVFQVCVRGAFREFHVQLER